MSKILIAYYSRKGQNYVNGDIKNLTKGNTEIIAEFIQKSIGGDLFEIATVKEYPIDYTECTNVAKEELRQKTRPELKNYLANIDEYDIIYLGYPCWWGLPPMAVFTFLEKYDFSGKIIKPFTTHEGSGLGGSISQIKKACPNASVSTGLAIHGAESSQSEKQVVQWAKQNI
ncbi:MAG: flavodoxin [Selenomonadaceae bacterium]|nr:flavodoxin [Selenomonadaceae bacterium]